MSPLLNLVTPLHRQTKRDCLARMVDNKVEAMLVSKQYGRDYWDGDRRYGYGGYRYDGRWKGVAQRLIETYNLGPDARILDVGCGKAHLLYELQQLLPQAECRGFDISEHGLADAPEPIRPFLFKHDARQPFPFPDGHFDLVISLGTLHNLRIFQLERALKEMSRVARRQYLMVESYRNEQELFNLQCWALTAESFFDEEEWIWLLGHFGYEGDYEFIFFE
ncbi:SAM-dependent methyltransferase [Geothrix limicola]|uniref:SAM-dependent methyltransferase n=1 Tax=Geothrix limicola TaxID=2927978 RepID=A0ABQ5QE97_9BACT|nr:class I SAM-dependent methyltransferase [Geothrix limicola]GLH73164.1 SAM-dependent methyltransferase [Geothrix limicola]